MTDTLPAPSASLSDPWVDDLDAELTCVAIRDETHDVRSFTFALPGAARLRFEPGQYLAVEVDIDGGTLQRCYTIASSPAVGAQPTITVKRKEGGPVSSWLHENLKVGGTVRARGPMGRFTLDEHPSAKYLFLSAGSGITPLMSMARHLRDSSRPADVVFLHSARTPADIIFRHELEELATLGLARVTVHCTDPGPAGSWDGPTGRLSLRTLLTAAPDVLDREVFTCGPPGYRAAARDLLEMLGLDPTRCHEESFVLGAGGPQDDAADGTGTSYRVELLRTGRVIDCPASTPVLTAAARAGLRLPSSCTEGVCGTCKATLLAGRVEMRHGGGIRQREIDEGKVLLCCARPTEDLVVDA